MATDGAELPDDSIVVGFTVLLLGAIGLLNASLGDIAADEAQARARPTALTHTDPRRLHVSWMCTASLLGEPDQQVEATTLHVHQGQGLRSIHVVRGYEGMSAAQSRPPLPQRYTDHRRTPQVS